ncbi:MULTISPECIES: SCO family protein [unclassified Neisseria]|uniref:SCO family protein n=1 Tax=unclassified Neisseria TaxID=2623750 RepID=UPI0026666166|nr:MULTISPECIES: SCO family protein [unclassified Neisseria]MDO1510130.1 SCO family protein [Neisseria sp. MVDL19-042950]MDO1516706.1 SCO family protein [Neisseria sp. MVDL18-041461]MDO1563853.1 SCO family protein [Neisseria sp. MVDL20-010259]
MNRMMKNLLFTTFALASLSACQPQEQAAPKPAEPAAASVVPQQAAAAAGFHGSDMRKEDIGGDFTMTDGNGKPFNISDLKGKVVILSFGYTHCPDVCPTELLTHRDALNQLGEQAKDVAVVFASVDPERDTPELIGKYVKQFHPDFIGLTATEGQNLPVIKQQYRVVSAKAQRQSEKVYLVDHTAGAYLLDKNGEVVVFEPYGSTAAQFADDIKILLKS